MLYSKYCDCAKVILLGLPLCLLNFTPCSPAVADLTTPRKETAAAYLSTEHLTISSKRNALPRT